MQHENGYLKILILAIENEREQKGKIIGVWEGEPNRERGTKKTRHNQKPCKRKEAEFTQKTQRNKVSSEKAKKRDRDGGAKIRTSRGRDWIVGWKISCREREETIF